MGISDKFLIKYMSLFKSIKSFFGGEDTRSSPNELKKLSPEELEEMIVTRRIALIKEFKLKQKGGEIGKGLVGMRNLGNTCFMNAALQCLSHSTLLTEYILTHDWENKINTVSSSAEGRLVCEYYLLLKKIWTENSYSVSPADIKKAIVKVSRTFAGYSQQDTQEFLSYFLDALHEDLNQVYIKPYIQQKDYAGEDVKKFSDGAWSSHAQRNKSFIVDSFHGQYYSKIRCPDCKHESLTCDPFDMLSLNLPSREQIKFEGYFISYTYDRDTCSLNFMVDDSLTLEKLLHKVVKDWNKQLTIDEAKLEVDHLVPYYMLRSRIVERLTKPYDQITVKEIMQNDGIFFIMEGYSHIYAPLVFKNQAQAARQQIVDGKFNYIISIQVMVNGKSIAVEKEIVVPETLTAYQLYLLIYIVYRKSFLNVSCKNYELIQLKLTESELEAEFKSFFPAETVDLKSALFNLSVNFNKITNITNESSIFDNVKSEKIDVVVCLNENFFSTEPKLKSCKKFYMDNFISTSRAQTLYNCLDQFVSEEKLDKDNMWYCPECKQNKEAYKKMAIVRYPKILVVHLKRFKKDLYKHHVVSFKKNTEIIDFPIENLELNNYVVNAGNTKIRYSLYGVANHYGSCGGGHYTATCKNRRDKTWHCFDDSDVSPIGENEIINDSAYVLFYELKK